MTHEPLKRKLGEDDYGNEFFTPKSIKSAVSGLIKFHEDRIEELINEVKICKDIWVEWICEDIRIEYESIMAIEHWLEDVI